MLRQVAQVDPQSGQTVIAWVDCGPRAAVPGHGRPTSGVYCAAGGMRNVALGGGTRQGRSVPEATR